LLEDQSISFTEDVGARYRAYGWHVQEVDDGNDLGAIERAIQSAREVRDQPSLIAVRTVLGAPRATTRKPAPPPVATPTQSPTHGAAR